VSDPSEKIYGMGQYQQEQMNLKGCNLELAHRNSQASIPFYVSSLGYGFLWNNAAIGEVHFGTNTTEWIAGATRQLDYWITAGDTPAEIMEAYADATGKAPMMPEYGLGFWQCKLRYYNQEQVLQVAREYKKRNIPVDVLVIDYYHWPRCGDWRFDEEYFPDPAAMVRELKEMGIETMVSIWPQVDWRSENYEEMKQQGLLVKINSGIDVQMNFHGNNVFMDATNPRTRRYVWEKCKKNYADLGIKTFWLDEAEPEFTTYDFETYRYFAGPVAEKGNIYPREYARLFYEGQKESGQDDIVNLIRCAWAGSQRYGTLVWSGDIMSTYEDFRKQICAGIHMGLSGIPWWTTDIGGFHGGVTADADFRELLVRWFQFGTFCPVMRIHGCRQPIEEIVNAAGEVREGTGADNEIWSFGDEATPILEKFIRIREKMRDYTRSLMQEAHEKGAPVMRAMFYEFPQDGNCWNITDAYMFGPDILVAPICHEKAVSRSVYLPQGASWVLASDGRTFEGGQTVEIEAPLSTLPVFLRDGRQGYLMGEI
jgi:alpha-D-xyloside xylohydrolase